MRRALPLSLLLALLLALPAQAAARKRAPAPDCLPASKVSAPVKEFIATMAERHGLDRKPLTEALRCARHLDSIVAAMDRPAESRPWSDYGPRVVSERRIQGGVDYWNRHADTLARAREAYGVPEEVIVAIIGVETIYGANTGSYRVLDALYTLAFGYPRRAEYFQKELEHFLLLARDEGLPLLDPKGSYAGAMGVPQFMPSSFREYAVDFDRDGHRNLWSDPDDAIGSVANYLKLHGWQAGEGVAVQATVDGETWRQGQGGWKPRRSIDELARLGAVPLEPVDPEARAIVVELGSGDAAEHWLGLANFYVITSYNRSVWYAMAVHQLARAIAQRRQDGIAARAD